MADNEQIVEIVAGCKDGDSWCFSRLVDMYSRRCYGYFYRLTGNRDISEELLGELFARLVEKISSFKGEYFDGWLFRIASNIFNDYLRDRQRQKKFFEKRREQFKEHGSEAEHDESEDVDKLQKKLSQLDEDTRELIMLRFYSDMSFKEMAEMRGEPIGTTLSKVHRGLQKLRELME
jgi:RNA polymerase sigma-70 factor (ECF subfamily)